MRRPRAVSSSGPAGSGHLYSLLHAICHAVGALRERAIRELAARRAGGFGADPISLCSLTPPGYPLKFDLHEKSLTP
jgi:hypothetical protein